MQISPTSHRRHPRHFTPMSDINVTPLVDVMLVLLIIFMVTAPLLTVGIPVELPQTKAAPLNEPVEPLIITMNQKEEIFIQESRVTLENMVPRLEAISKNNKAIEIYIRGDQKLPYGKIMEIMGLLSAEGFSKVALITETQPDKK